MKQPQRQINYPMALWRRKWLILPLMVLGLGGALLAFSRVTPLYRSQATVVLIPQTISREVYPKGWDIGDRLKFIEREINSTSFLDALAEAQGVAEKDPEKLRRLTRTVGVRKLDGRPSSSRRSTEIPGLRRRRPIWWQISLSSKARSAR